MSAQDNEPPKCPCPATLNIFTMWQRMIRAFSLTSATF